MAIKFKAVKHKLALGGDENNIRYYARVCDRSRIGIQEISKLIEKASSLTEVEIRGALLALLNRVLQFLLDGRTVDLDEFGLVSLTVTSEGSDTAEEVTADNIKEIKVHFRPSPRMKQMLKGAVFQKVD